MTYDPAHSTDKDRLRFIVGDTKAPEIYSDPEYLAALARYTDVRGAAVEVLRSLIGEAAKNLSSLNVGGAVSLDWQARVPGWKASLQSIEAELRHEAVAAATGDGFGSAAAVRGDLDGGAEYVNSSTPVPWGD